MFLLLTFVFFIVVLFIFVLFVCFFFFKQKTAYEVRISDWSSDVCSSDLAEGLGVPLPSGQAAVFEPVGGHEMLVGEGAMRDHAVGEKVDQIGRASCRERVCQYV